MNAIFARIWDRSLRTIG